MFDSLRIIQNADGGWPYRHGGSSWTEPTVYSLLAGYASQDDSGRARALGWLRSQQRSDGGFAPNPGVAQSTWVTALVALLPPAGLGTDPHERAIAWLLDLTSSNSTLLFRLRSWMRRENGVSDGDHGWPWFPGTAAWATPTAIATLALAKQNRRSPDTTLKERIRSGRSFLLAHRCADGGWNHGAMNALGIPAPSYPETTGTGLLALAGTDASTLSPSIHRAEAWWNDCPSSEAASWLMLALRATGRPKLAPPDSLKPRTVQDAALHVLAAAGDRGTEIFLA